MIGGGLLATFGPVLDKQNKMKRQLTLEYAAQKRFRKSDLIDP